MCYAALFFEPPGLSGSFDDGNLEGLIGFGREGFACDRFYKPVR